MHNFACFLKKGSPPRFLKKSNTKVILSPRDVQGKLLDFVRMANRQTRNDSQYSGITTRVGNQGCIKLARQPDPPHSPVLRAGERISFFLASSSITFSSRKRVIEFRRGQEYFLHHGCFHYWKVCTFKF